MLCFRKMSVTKKFMDHRGVSRLSIESLVSHSTEKLRGGNIMCYVSKFQKLSVTIRWECQDFP